MSLTSTSDAGLVARCRAGDQGAWRELVRRFSPYVYAIVVRAYGIPEHEARDVFQEVFLRTWERLESLRDDAAIKPWIAQVARNLAREQLRRGGRRREHELTLEELDPAGVDERLDELDEALALREELAALPEDCRAILERFYVRDESYRAIAAELGLTTGALAGRKSRCLELLGERLRRTSRRDGPSGGM